MYFVSIQTVLEMHWLPTGIGKQMHSKWHLEQKKMHFLSIQTVSKMHLFLSRIGITESDWQANAFKWSFGST